MDSAHSATSFAAAFGCNTYSYIRSHAADDCVARLADNGFRAFELMVYPGHLWPRGEGRGALPRLRRQIADRNLRLVSLNMPNIDINIGAAAPEMRAYSLDLVADIVQLAGDLGAEGVVVGPGKANPLFPAAGRGTDRAFLPASTSWRRWPKAAARRCGSRTCPLLTCRR